MAGVLEYLRSADAPLFALLDAGRDPEVLTFIYGHDLQARSLYQGASEATLGPSGPFLVALDPRGAPLAALLRRAWGKSWGLYLTSNADFDALRRHFRSLLMVRRQRDQAELYFRFYDPRVLSAFVPTCDRAQLDLVFGPVASYLMESRDRSEVLRFRVDGGALVSDALSLHAAGDAAHA
jgi:hypothetical protein